MNFLPGAVKYGDVPALLSLCAPVKTAIIGETKDSAAGVAAAFAAAKDRMDFVGVTKAAVVELVVNALTNSH